MTALLPTPVSLSPRQLRQGQRIKQALPLFWNFFPRIFHKGAHGQEEIDPQSNM